MPDSKSEVWKIWSVNRIFIASQRPLTANIHFAASATPTPPMNTISTRAIDISRN
ncbi:MAG: hypothetical protein V7K81_10120 [Nostoc sp.]